MLLIDKINFSVRSLANITYNCLQNQAHTENIEGPPSDEDYRGGDPNGEPDSVTYCPNHRLEFFTPNNTQHTAMVNTDKKINAGSKIAQRFSVLY